MQEFQVNESRVKQWRAKIALMQSNNPSKELKELLDLVSITPIMSIPAVSTLDDEISTMIENQIQDVTVIINKIKERNILLKQKT
jgi:hypothetical protein